MAERDEERDTRQTDGDRRLRRYVLRVFALLGTLLAGYAVLRYLLPITLPFLFAWTVAFAVREPAHRLATVTHLPERVLRVALGVSVLLGMTGIFAFLLSRLALQAWEFLSGLPGSEEFGRALSLIGDPLGALLGGRSPASDARDAVGGAIRDTLSSVLASLGSWLTGAVAAVPRALFFLLVTVIATVYFTADLEQINRRVRSFLPRPVARAATAFRARSLSVMLRYGRAYLLLMLLSFSVVFTGLCIIRVPYAFLIALVIALLDVLPVIGVGTVLVPWSVSRFLLGDIPLGVSLLILFVVHEVIRQFAEPKIIGRNLGVHPVLTLLMLYGGYTLLGLGGLLLLPLFAILVNTLAEQRRGENTGQQVAEGEKEEAGPP